MSEVARRTHCALGHPYSGNNVYVAPDGMRQCRACRRKRTHDRKAGISIQRRDVANQHPLTPCTVYPYITRVLYGQIVWGRQWSMNTIMDRVGRLEARGYRIGWRDPLEAITYVPMLGQTPDTWLADIRTACHSNVQEFAIPPNTNAYLIPEIQKVV